MRFKRSRSLVVISFLFFGPKDEAWLLSVCFRCLVLSPDPSHTRRKAGQPPLRLPRSCARVPFFCSFSPFLRCKYSVCGASNPTPSFFSLSPFPDTVIVVPVGRSVGCIVCVSASPQTLSCRWKAHCTHTHTNSAPASSSSPPPSSLSLSASSTDSRYRCRSASPPRIVAALRASAEEPLAHTAQQGLHAGAHLPLRLRLRHPRLLLPPHLHPHAEQSDVRR